MSELHGALIGCGFFARNQMHAWKDIPGVSIVAICDRDEARLAEMGESFAVEARYRDAATMLREVRPDFVDIATTAPSHRALVELAASLKIPAICQKPIAPTIDDARAMVDACEAAGVPLMIHENFRWQSPIQAVRRVLDRGEIDHPSSLVAASPPPPWCGRDASARVSERRMPSPILYAWRPTPARRTAPTTRTTRLPQPNPTG